MWLRMTKSSRQLLDDFSIRHSCAIKKRSTQRTAYYVGRVYVRRPISVGLRTHSLIHSFRIFLQRLFKSTTTQKRSRLQILKRWITRTCHLRPRTPAGRCKEVHLHPQDFAFQIFLTFSSSVQFFCMTLFMHRICLIQYFFLQSEIQQQVLVFHK